MKIYHKKDALSAAKPEGTNVNYFLFSEYEIHYNEQAPGTIQTWHHHEKIWETLFIIEGELIAKWKEKGEEKTEILHAGDVVETERTPHTFSNEGKKMVKFLVFKHVPSGKDYRELLKTDKVIDQ